MSCRYCDKELSIRDPKIVRAYGYDGNNTNFCSKWCCLEYYETLEPDIRKRSALSYWLQRFGRVDSKTGKRQIPSRVSEETRKIMESFSFVVIKKKGERKT